MRDIRNFSAVILASLLIVLAGCATRTYFYSETKGGATKIYNKAKSLYSQKRYEDAQKYFQQVISNHPESPLVKVAMYYLGGCYKEKKEYQKAISTYQKIIDKDTSSFWANSARQMIQEIKSTQKK